MLGTKMDLQKEYFNQMYANGASFTLDFTSNEGREFMAITGHFISKDW